MTVFDFLLSLLISVLGSIFWHINFADAGTVEAAVDVATSWAWINPAMQKCLCGNHLQRHFYWSDYDRSRF